MDPAELDAAHDGLEAAAKVTNTAAITVGRLPRKLGDRP